MKNLICFVCGVALGAFAVWLWWCKPERLPMDGTDGLVVCTVKDTVVVVDTLVVASPRAAATVPVAKVERMMVADDGAVEGGDSLAVSIPIVQRVYSGGEGADMAAVGYTAWISGYEPSLDSLRITFPRREVSVERIVSRSARGRGGFGLGITAGVGLTPHGFEPFVGLGVSYTFVTF